MSVPLHIRVSEELKERLEALAETERRSLNNVVRILLEDALDERERAEKRRTKRRS